MGRKNVILSHKMLDDISLITNASSDPTNVANLDRASVSIEWSASDAVGSITFQGRKKKLQTSEVDADWFELDFGSTIDITGGAGDHQVIFDSLDFTELRVNYNYVSGTIGTLKAVITAKQIGG